MVVKAQSQMKRTKKKNWLDIVAPTIFNKQIVGETHTSNPQSKIGTVFSISLSNLVRDPRKQAVKIYFKINGLEGNKLSTQACGYEVSTPSIKRFVRRNISRVDDTFVVRTKDEQLLKIKPFLITRSIVSNSLKTKLRKRVRYLVTKAVAERNLDEVMQLVVAQRLQMELKNQLKKVYPLRIIELRKIELLPPGKAKPLVIKSVPKKKSQKSVKKSTKNAQPVEAKASRIKKTEKTE